MKHIKRKLAHVCVVLFALSILITGCNSKKVTPSKNDAPSENDTPSKMITIKDFEDLGYRFIDGTESGGFLRFALSYNGVNLAITNSLDTVWYMLPTGEKPSSIFFASKDATDYSDVGHGIAMSQNGMKNLYKIASLLSRKPEYFFIECFSEELQEEFKKHDIQVTISGGEDWQGNVDGNWSNPVKRKWYIAISSGQYYYYNAENDRGLKGMHIWLESGNDPSAFLFTHEADDVIGAKEALANPGFSKELETFREMIKKPGISFDPETMKITFTPECEEALKRIIPYLDMP